MAGVITKPKNVIPTEVYLRGNEVSRIPVEQTSKYRIATDEEIQSIINAFDPGSGGQGVDYNVATDQEIEDIIGDFPDDNNQDDQVVVVDDEIEYNVASNDDIQNIIDGEY